MIGWLKNFFRVCLRKFLKWCLEDLNDVSHFIEVVDPGPPRITYKMEAVGVSGLSLVCRRNEEEKLVRHRDAADPDHWLRLWETLGGSKKITWADGTPFEF